MEKIPKISFVSSADTKTIDFILLEELMARKNLVSNHSPFKLHRINFNMLLINTSEKVIHKVDFQEYELKKNEALLLTKGQVHSFGNKEDYRGYLILLNDEFILKHLSVSANQQLSILKPYHLRSPKFFVDELLLQYISNISTIWNQREQSFFEDLLANQVIGLLFQLQLQRIAIKQEINTENNRAYALFSQFNDLIQNASSTSRNAQYYAKEMAVTYKVLNNTCKDITGLTAKEFIDQFVTLEAKRIIATKNSSILETAINCGFQDPTNFTKFFKKQTGYTPSQFKSKIN